MTAIAHLLNQRSIGHVKLHMDQGGPLHIRESGASKVRLPRGTHEAILINTGGGLAGGDDFQFDFACAPGAMLTVTSQAAERVYRTLGPPAKLATKIALDAGSSFAWLPQETILYDGAALTRDYSVQLARGARFLALEPVVFGRTEMGENLASLALHDRWQIFSDGQLIHAEDLRIGPELPRSKATLDGNLAMASLIYIADDAEAKVEAIGSLISGFGGVSSWNGKLIARLVAKDGFGLRKALIPVLHAISGPGVLPKIWTA
jgi:urease accessory protein